MTKNEFENKSLVLITLFGFIGNIVYGWVGAWFVHGSAPQVLLFQIGNAFAIAACVMAGRYTGLRGQHVAASAYILLGITHGISLAALSSSGINADREATMAMPMIPSLIFMLWCDLYPKWLRYFGLLPSIFFITMYTNVHLGDQFLGWTLYMGYATLQISEVLWGVFLYKDWKKTTVQK